MKVESWITVLGLCWWRRQCTDMNNSSPDYSQRLRLGRQWRCLVLLAIQAQLSLSCWHQNAHPWGVWTLRSSCSACRTTPQRTELSYITRAGVNSGVKKNSPIQQKIWEGSDMITSKRPANCALEQWIDTLLQLAVTIPLWLTMSAWTKQGLSLNLIHSQQSAVSDVIHSLNGCPFLVLMTH